MLATLHPSLQHRSAEIFSAMSAAASALSTIQTEQLALNIVSCLALTAWQYPPTCSPSNGSYYDFIVVGGGAGGSAVAGRLAELNASVLLIEAGSYAPLESDLPGLFPVLPQSAVDYNISSVNDNYTAQNLQDSSVSMTSGKMLGGSSGLSHMIYVRTDPHDFNNWADMLNDSAWNNTCVKDFFLKLEKLIDPQLLNSSYAQLHGTDGNVKIAKDPNESNKPILEAFRELGNLIREDSTSDNSTCGYCEPLFHIADGVRQNAALSYLNKKKYWSNICLALSTTATKILMKSGTAVGVQVTDSSGDTQVFYSNKEVVISAGAINSPKLLMLSGIGPKAHLKSLGIDVVADLPVGQNLHDHPSASLLYQMAADTSTTSASNPHTFPVPTTCGYKSVSSNIYPDYQVINLIFPHDSSALVELCSKVFKYSNDICDKMYAASSDRQTMYVVLNLMQPQSRGKVLLSSSSYTDAPLVYTNTFGNSSDLTLLTESLLDFHQVVNTTYFKSIDATLVDYGLCNNTSDLAEYFKCYAISMSATMWHYAGTCSMGTVVDTSLRVKGITNLRVADASVMPTQVSGNIYATVCMIGEKCADLLATAWNL